ncbi:Aminodeoxychorismate synthase [Favolaschia claudopus]|uniref:Aminodeoxychorismate synthase n=1 Tax=Favolaschia claudopus TaxID=2862362 RepID=A0AAW0DHC1_9AGAR
MTDNICTLPDGIKIFYTDSGAPETSDYTTLVIFHGTGFNAFNFNPLHAHAHSNNLRIIACNRREYHGSTPLTDDEVAELNSGSPAFLTKKALLVAQFLEYLIKQQSTPRLTDNRQNGGFVVMGWSFGAAYPIALLAQSTAIPPELYQTIEPYLRAVVVNEPPIEALGLPPPPLPTLYNAFTDPEYPAFSAKFQNFQNWISSYFEHPDLTSDDPAGLYVGKPLPESCGKSSTFSRWSAEEKARYCEAKAPMRADLPVTAPAMQTHLNAQFKAAFFFNFNFSSSSSDLVSYASSSHFPRTPILYVCGTETAYPMLWAYKTASAMYAHAAAGERGDTASVRPTTFQLVEGGNHFMHYDMPDVLLREVVAGCVS